ncbi:MAG: TonB-dependent receptor [Bacteroidales bacterium]|nr:TonB-dependent receptor [Bacteroidales bacterium]
MKFIYKISLSLIFLVLIKDISFSQSNIKISGTVTDIKDNSSLPGANIYLKSDWMKGTITDQNGKFCINVNASNIVDTLIVSFIGYKEKTIVVSRLKNEEIDIHLIQFSKEIEETVIRAKRVIAEEFTIKQMKKLDIYLNPSSKADPLLAVNSMPSSTTIDETANISLRGSSPAETGIFFNDVPIYDAIRFSQINGIGTFSIFNTAIVQRMLVFPGNPPLEYSNSTAGLISIQSENQIPEINTNSFTLSLASLSGLTSRKLGKKSSIIVFTNYQPDILFKKLNEKSFEDLKKFSTIDLGVHYILNFNKKTSFKVFNYSNNESFDYYLRHPSYNGSFNQNKKRNFTVLNFTENFTNSELTINNGISFSSENFKYGNNDINIEKRNLYLSLNYFYFFDKLSIKSGVNIDSRKKNLSGDFPVFDYAINTNHPVYTLDDSESLNVPELYSYAKYNVNKKMVIGVGLRKNIAINKQKDYLSAQVNMNYKLNYFNSINLSIGEYNKYNQSNAEVYSSYLINSKQISIDYKYNSDYLEFTSSVFHKLTKFNEKNNKIYGAEIFTSFDIKDKLRTQLSYTFIDAHVKDNIIEYPTKYDFNYFIRGDLKYFFKHNISLSLVFVYRQGNYYSPLFDSYYINNLNTYKPEYQSLDNSVRMPDYKKLDISLTKILLISDKRNIIMFFSISNIFNTKNIEHINYNSDYTQAFNEYYSKRTVYFGAVFNFM